MIVEALTTVVVIVVVNFFLRLMIQYFIFLKKCPSYSQEQSLFCWYYSFIYTFNTCFMVYLIQNQIKEFEQNNLLMYQIHFIMVANALS